MKNIARPRDVDALRKWGEKSKSLNRWKRLKRVKRQKRRIWELIGLPLALGKSGPGQLGLKQSGHEQLGPGSDCSGPNLLRTVSRGPKEALGALEAQRAQDVTTMRSKTQLKYWVLSHSVIRRPSRVYSWFLCMFVFLYFDFSFGPLFREKRP